MKALAIGEILFDIFGGEEHVGGAPFNPGIKKSHASISGRLNKN